MRTKHSKRKTAPAPGEPAKRAKGAANVYLERFTKLRASWPLDMDRLFANGLPQVRRRTRS